MAEQEKCVIVLSGGLDSATVAYWARKEGYNSHGLTFKYGQIATKETEYAQLVARELDLPLRMVDLSSLKELFAGVTSLCDKRIEMTSSFSQPLIVPFRNAIFLSVAVAYASAISARKIFYGAQGSDQPFYPDCRKCFYESFQKTAQMGTDKEMVIEAPFSDMQKPDVVKLGSKLGVPFDLTWSCYLSGKRHCGKCESCINRKKAFAQASVQDPTDYVE